ncbi:MAG: hypothetical protein OXI01_23345 [Albidovulum sp.]|nr:hypothetical protein [Albidovulum sp.]
MNVPARVAEGLAVRSAEEWREIVEDFEREGVTAAAYCERRGLRPRTQDCLLLPPPPRRPRSTAACPPSPPP